MKGSEKSETSLKPLPPGRTGLPYIGETAAIARSNHGFYKDRFKKYGPIFKTRLFGLNFAVISGPEAFSEFATNPAFVRGEADPISVRQIFFRSLALTDGAEHRARKGVMLRAFRPEALERYVPRMERVMLAYIDRWEATGEFAWRPELFLLAASLSGALYTGDESEAHVRELSTIVAWMREAFTTIPVNLPGTPYGRAVKGRNRLLALVQEALDRHRRGGYDDVVSRMLDAIQEPGSRVTEDEVRRDLLHLLFASQGGFAVPLTLMLMTLGQRPDLMERAREEVLSVAPDGPLTMERLDRMEYLDRMSRELRRFYAMNSATFFARAKETVEVGGYRIPAGWGVIAAIHITMRNPAVFDNPNRFDPDRFLPERAAQMAPNSYVPHGAGPREGHKCPGEDIVGISVKMMLALLLRRFAWTLPAQDLELDNTLFPLPRGGLQVRLFQYSTQPAESAVR